MFAKLYKDKSLFWTHLIICAFVFVLYGNTLKNGYNLDDEYVVNNTFIEKGISAIPEIFRSYYSDDKKGQYGYRPIVKTTFAIEYSIFGKNPAISHLINLIIYLITGIFLLKLLKVLLKEHDKILPFIIVLLFLAHPIHTEVVTSLKNREELLSFLFCLFSLWFFYKSYQIKPFLNIFLGLLFIILAYLTKENSLTFIAIIPLALYFFTDTKAKNIIIVTLIVGLSLIALRIIVTKSLPDNVPVNLWQNPLFGDKNRLLQFSTGLFTILYYLKLLIFPHPLRFYYGFDMIPIIELTNIWFYISLIVCLSLFVYAIFTIKQKNILSFSILYFFISISMFSNILIPVTGIVAERLVYFASLGFSIALGYLIYKFHKRKIPNKIVKSTIYIICGLILIPYTLKSITRNRDWKDEYTLYSHDVQYSERSVKVNEMYVGELIKKLNTSNDNEKLNIARDVIKYSNNIVKIYPKSDVAWNYLGSMNLLYFNKPDIAIDNFKKAIEANPLNALYYHNIGYINEKLNNNTISEEYYKKAISADSSYFQSSLALSDLYIRQNRDEEALKVLLKSAEYNLENNMSLLKLGNYYLTRNDTIAALPYLEKAIAIDSSDKNLCLHLAKYYERKNINDKANYYYNLSNKKLNK